ncbi:MAG TPA: DUF3263 domain-containing protein [Nocardioides sp.]|uniref:DUF3263 domain-containing protein n=1 Tax=Nocardioides sp. TaxID=35761 RepID=UPI002EDA1717
MQKLTDDEKAILDFEGGGWWKHAGAKEQAIRERFDWSATRYFQVLNALIDKPAALEHDPLLVRRLVRLRDQRAHQRSLRRLSMQP